MRSVLYSSFFACISIALAASESGARPAYPSHRMIRKRVPSPLFKELHATSEDPTTAKDLLSPVTDAIHSPDTMSDFFDKGHLTGPGSVLEAEKITGSDSLLDADKLHLMKGDQGVDLSGIDVTTLPVVSSLAHGDDSPVTDLIDEATHGQGLNGINIRRRGVLDLMDAGVNTDALASTPVSDLPGADQVLDVVNEVHLGGRLRGRKVKTLLPSLDAVRLLEDGNAQLSPIPSIIDVTLGKGDRSDSFAAHGSPYQAARKQAELSSTWVPRA